MDVGATPGGGHVPALGEAIDDGRMDLSGGFVQEARIPPLRIAPDASRENRDGDPLKPTASGAGADTTFDDTVGVRPTPELHPLPPRLALHAGPDPRGHILVGRVDEDEPGYVSRTI